MSIKGKKITLICGASQTVLTFRKKFIERLIGLNCKVSLIVFDDKFINYFREIGVEVFVVGSDNRSLNPIEALKLKKAYKKIIKMISPDIVFTFMLKPNIFGSISAKEAGVKKIYSMVEGAGDVFANRGFKWSVIRFIICFFYKIAFKNCNKVFFLNNDDKQEFVNRKILKEDQCYNVFGIGVDLDKFCFTKISNDAHFLMVARMLKTKGVLEYCKCAREVKKKYPNAVFEYLGDEGTVKLSEIREFISDGSIIYHGFNENVLPYLQKTAVFCLPSYYREGMPMSIMEAQSVGRVVITTNNVGCRDTVIDGYNGFLVEVKDYRSLIEKCIWCIENFEKVVEMGVNARCFAEKNFDSNKINDEIISILER